MHSSGPDETAQANSPSDGTLDRLTALDQELAETPGEAIAMMREHLAAARYYRIGNMPQECIFNLKLAEDILPQIEYEGLRDRISGVIRDLSSEAKHG